MIDVMSQMDAAILDKCFFVFPMTYPDGVDDYIRVVEERLIGITKHFKIIRDYLSTKEMAEIAVVSDIMIHVQTTDQLSSTMLSHMYCGNVVIAGSWLPYDVLKRKGISFITIDDVSELGNRLSDVIENIDSIKKENDRNKAIIHEMSSWVNASKKWYSVYDALLSR